MKKLVLILLLSVSASPEVSPQRGFMVWDAGCIKSISKGLKTRLEAPLVDGFPDMSRAHVYDEVVDFEKTCGRIEVRREK